MILISHRGNIDCATHPLENTIAYIQRAIDSGYYVEIDVWKHSDKLWLGHDAPERVVNLEWLNTRSKSLFIHAKNHKALEFFTLENDILIPVFYHTCEDHVIIGNTNLIWSHKPEEAGKNSIIPLLSFQEIQKKEDCSHVYGICSDFVGSIGECK